MSNKASSRRRLFNAELGKQLIAACVARTAMTPTTLTVTEDKVFRKSFQDQWHLCNKLHRADLRNVRHTSKLLLALMVTRKRKGMQIKQQDIQTCNRPICGKRSVMKSVCEICTEKQATTETESCVQILKDTPYFALIK